MIEEATGYVDELATDQFSGTVLVAKGDEVLLERAIGLASRRYSIPNNMDTLFNLGSINKIFTKLGIAQLAARGRLSFDDPVAKHLPDYPNREVAEAITVQQVVTNRLPAEALPRTGIGIGVAGGAPGVNAELEIGGEYTIIVLSNLDPPSASNVARHLRDLVEALE